MKKSLIITTLLALCALAGCGIIRREKPFNLTTAVPAYFGTWTSHFGDVFAGQVTISADTLVFLDGNGDGFTLSDLTWYEYVQWGDLIYIDEDFPDGYIISGRLDNVNGYDLTKWGDKKYRIAKAGDLTSNLWFISPNGQSLAYGFGHDFLGFQPGSWQPFLKQPSHNADTTLTEDEIIRYLETFKELLLNNKIEELADLIHFPVEGNYVWEDGNDEIHFNPYRTEADFIENYPRLFGEDLVNLLEKADFTKAFKEDYHVTIKREPNIELTFNIIFAKTEHEKHIDFSVNYDETDCDVCESSVIYRLGKVDGKIKLTAIQMAG